MKIDSIFQRAIIHLAYCDTVELGGNSTNLGVPGRFPGSTLERYSPRQRIRIMNMLRVAWILFVLLGSVAVGVAQEPGFESDANVKRSLPSISLQPKKPVTGDRLKLTVKISDSFVRAEAKWSVNGSVVQEDMFTTIKPVSELDKDLRADDKVEVEVIVTDITTGDTLKKHVKKVVYRNGPPMLELVDQQIDSTMYTATIKAEDPEGDKFTLKLKKAPKGMTIDPDGKIHWKVDRDVKGKFNVVVAAKDENGKETELTFGFNLRWTK